MSFRLKMKDTSRADQVVVALVMMLTWCQSAFGQSSYRPAVPVGGQAMCTIAGKVLNAVSGEPLANARVMLTPTGKTLGRPLQTRTDASGAFILSMAASGPYAVSVEKGNFQGLESFPSGAATLTPTPGKRYESVFRLTPFSTISGVVLDEGGEPATDIRVQAIGNMRSQTSAQDTRSTITNDLGEFRLHGVVPGVYYVVAHPKAAPCCSSARIADPLNAENYVDTFYPRSSKISEALAVKVGAGQELQSIDIHLIKLRIQVAQALDLTQFATIDSDTASFTEGDEPRLNAEASDDSALPSPSATSTVSGDVVDRLSGRPVKDAEVILRNMRDSGDVPYVSNSNSVGHFLIKGVNPGRYRVLALRDGFLPGLYGLATSATGEDLIVRQKQDTGDILLTVTPTAVIGGQVLNLNEEPLADVRVQALRKGYLRGRRHLNLVATAITDDRGLYRLFGLAPGDYYIQTSETQGSNSRPLKTGLTEKYVPTFYPSAGDVSGAIPVSVGPGNEVGGVNISARRSTSASIRGRVFGCPQVRNTVISLSSDVGSIRPPTGNMVTSVNRTGDFQIGGVLPGSYILSAICQEGRVQYAGTRFVVVNRGDVNSVSVGLARAKDVLGKISVQGGGSLNLGSVQVLLQPESDVQPSSVLAPVQSNGTFLFRTVSSDKYRLSVLGMPARFYVRSVEIAGETAADQVLDFQYEHGPISIVLSSSSGTILGSVFNTEQGPAVGEKVALVPDSDKRGEHQLYKYATTDAAGQFRISGIVPGRYSLFASETAEPDAYFNSDFIAAVEPSAQSISVGENATVSVVVHLITGDNVQ
jgi:protocatechuate 3,4-dioxygenase beta subunit